MKKKAAAVSALILGTVALLSCGIFAALRLSYRELPQISKIDFSACTRVEILYYDPRIGENRQMLLTDQSDIRRLVEDTLSLRGRREKNQVAKKVGGTFLQCTFLFSDGGTPVTVTRAGQQLMMDGIYYGTKTPYADWLLQRIFHKDI